ncbi:MAG: hypothetical protein R3C19_10105 [Planctomycetaceae bacterium]
MPSSFSRALQAGPLSEIGGPVTRSNTILSLADAAVRGRSAGLVSA